MLYLFVYLFIFSCHSVDYEINSINEIYYISDKAVCTIKQNIKETFLESNGVAI